MKCTQIKYSLLLLALLPVALVTAQRAGYAGARPNGLSQKDKYFNTVITGGSTNGTVSFDTRFGETPPTVNTLAFGVSQRPPVGAFVVPVAGQQTAVVGIPLAAAPPPAAAAGTGTTATATPTAGAAQVPAIGTQQQQQPGVIAFAPRLGDADNNGVATANGSTLTTTTQTQAQPTATGTVQQQQPQEPLPMPLDAGGDRILIEQLSRLPQDRQPFWFLNYQAIERQRNGTGTNFAGSIASRGSFMG